MTQSDDIEGLAAEYVLGTLDAAERTQVAARRQREADLDLAIREWERRLGPLDRAVQEKTPSPEVWRKIQARISSATAGGGGSNVVELQKRLTFWRRAAIAASTIAAALVLALGARELTPPPKSKNLVAVLQKDAQSPAFLVSVDIDNRMMTVRPVAAKPEKGKSYELWLVHDSLGAPKSLGVIDDPKSTVRPTLAAYKRDVFENATLAVSLEPEGGSPTGAPTGPVVFSGKMIEQ